MTSGFYEIFITVFIVIVINVYTKEHSSNYFVWKFFQNETGMNTDDHHLGNRIYIVFIGLLNTLFAFSGYEAGARCLINFF